jgi:hypothetical protein
MYDNVISVSTPQPSIEDELATVAAHLNVSHANLVEITARALADEGWSGSGIHSPAHWLMIQMGLSPARARQVVAIAERIVEFPVARDAFRRGELSVEQVTEIVTKAPAWADDEVTEFAKAATVRQLRRVIRDEHFAHDPEEPEPEPSPERDRVSLGWDEHGRFHLHAHGPADRGVVVEAALNEAATRCSAPARRTSPGGTRSAKSADDHSAPHHWSGGNGSRPTSTSRSTATTPS